MFDLIDQDPRYLRSIISAQFLVSINVFTEKVI